MEMGLSSQVSDDHLDSEIGLGRVLSLAILGSHVGDIVCQQVPLQ